MEVTAAERCGVKAEKLSTSSMQKAQKVMIDRLSQDQPLMIQVDMGLMPYFPFYRQFHFGYHMVAAAGYDPQTNEITIADRDGTPYAVPLEQVSAARASTYKPFPPHNTWMDYDFSSFHMPDQTALKTAIKECALGMLRPPIKNLGIKGIQTAMQGMLSWTKSMDDEMLASACANVALYIRADAGTGGGLFRWMYAQFLREAGDILHVNTMSTIAEEFDSAGRLWEQIADIAEQIKDKSGMEKRSLEISSGFEELYRVESAAWNHLLGGGLTFSG